MRRTSAIALALAFALCATIAQAKDDSPTDAALKFYRALRNKRYVEGFRHSIYRKAIEGLSQAELKELEPDFAQTFADIPEKIESRGEQITGDAAIVTLKFDGIDELQQVALIRVAGQWLVGDQESLTVVSQQGRGYFFNTRMAVNEEEAFKMLARIIGAELIYANKFEGRCASIQELARLGGVPQDLLTGEANGYRFSFTLSQDQKSFTVTAVPVAYSKTGRLSFYGDWSGVRAEDLKGQPATQSSPVFQPKLN